jgi:hypothetical protein
VEKAKSSVISAIKFVVLLVFLFGLIKWAQANPAQWQQLVDNIVRAAAATLNAILNAIVNALPASSSSG